MYERIENASIRLFCKYIFSAALPDLFMTGMVAVDFRGWAGGGAARWVGIAWGGATGGRFP